MNILCEAYYRYKEEFRQHDVHSNIVIAAFTTAFARLQLYDLLERFEPGSLSYADTDSALFAHKPGGYEPPTGPLLGQLTDELSPKDGKLIKTFVSGGQKSYAYATDIGHIVVKLKGITLNHSTSKILNFESLKEMVQPNSELKSLRVPLPGKITRDRKNHN